MTLADEVITHATKKLILLKAYCNSKSEESDGEGTENKVPYDHCEIMSAIEPFFKGEFGRITEGKKKVIEWFLKVPVQAVVEGWDLQSEYEFFCSMINHFLRNSHQ